MASGWMSFAVTAGWIMIIVKRRAIYPPGMQRRAAALYAALFVLLAAGAYGTIAVAQAPAISIQNPDYTVTQGQDFSVNDQSYTATTVGNSEAELTWVNESARFTESLEASPLRYDGEVPDDTQARIVAVNEDIPIATVDGTDYRVIVQQVDGEPDRFALVEAFALSENISTQTVDNTTYVVVEEGASPSLVALDEWVLDNLGQPTTQSFSEGGSFSYSNETTTIESVNNESVTLVWTGERENTVTMAEGETADLAGQTFIAHFPDPNTLVLTSDVAGYEQQEEIQDTYQERINGLWGVTILGTVGAVLLLGLGFMPSRY